MLRVNFWKATSLRWQMDPDPSKSLLKETPPLFVLNFHLRISSLTRFHVMFCTLSPLHLSLHFCSNSQFYLCAYLFFWTKVLPYCLMPTHSFPLMVIPHLTAGRWDTEASPVFLICRQKKFWVLVVNMFLAYLVSAVLRVRILGGEEKKWHQDGATVYERMSAKKRLEPCCPLQCLFVQGGSGFIKWWTFFHIQLENNYEWPLNSKLTARSISNRFNLEGIGPDPECVYESEQRYPPI